MKGAPWLTWATRHGSTIIEQPPVTPINRATSRLNARGVQLALALDVLLDDVGDRKNWTAPRLPAGCLSG
jgi:hypothetical protein